MVDHGGRWAEPTFAPAHPIPFDQTVDRQDSALELAEIMMSFGRTQGAAETLADYIPQQPRQAVEAVAETLEDLLRGGHAGRIRGAHRQLNKTFNVKMVKLERLQGHPLPPRTPSSRWPTSASAYRTCGAPRKPRYTSTRSCATTATAPARAFPQGGREESCCCSPSSTTSWPPQTAGRADLEAMEPAPAADPLPPSTCNPPRPSDRVVPIHKLRLDPERRGQMRPRAFTP